MGIIILLSSLTYYHCPTLNGEN